MSSASEFLAIIGSDFGETTLSDEGQIIVDSTGNRNSGPFAFCLTFLYREVKTLLLYENSPGAAADVVAAMVAYANASNPGWAAFSGYCPTGV